MEPEEHSTQPTSTASKKRFYLSTTFARFLNMGAIAAIIIFFSAYSYNQHLRIVELEKKAELLSNYNLKSKSNIEIVSNEVAKLKENKDFIKDSYSTNIGWASLVLSIMVTGVFGLTVYTVVDNSGKVKEVKDEFNRQIEEENEKLKKNYETQLDAIKYEVYENKAQTYRLSTINLENNKLPSIGVFHMLEVIESEIKASVLNKSDKEINNKQIINDINYCQRLISISKVDNPSTLKELKDSLSLKIKTIIDLNNANQKFESFLRGIQDALEKASI